MLEETTGFVILFGCIHFSQDLDCQWASLGFPPRFCLYMKLWEAVKKFEAWKTYSIRLQTVKRYHYELRHFCLYLRNIEIEQVGLDDILSYLKDLKELGWDQNCFISKTTAIKKLFKFHQLQGLKIIDPDLIPQAQYEPRIPKVMDDETHNRLLAQCASNSEDDLRNRALLMMLWDTGARCGELCTINIEDLNLVEKKALIRTEKSKHVRPFREIMWTEKTNDVLKKWLGTRESNGALFISLSRLSGGQRLRPHGVASILRRLCEWAKLPRINPHSYRHHMAHDVLNKGFSIVHVAKVLGHSSAKSSLAYLHINDKELRETYRKVKGD